VLFACGVACATREGPAGAGTTAGWPRGGERRPAGPRAGLPPLPPARRSLVIGLWLAWVVGSWALAQEPTTFAGQRAVCDSGMVVPWAVAQEPTTPERRGDLLAAAGEPMPWSWRAVALPPRCRTKAGHGEGPAGGRGLQRA